MEELIEKCSIIKNVTKLTAIYVSAQDLIRYRENAPVANRIVNTLPEKTHYWNLITLSGKQNEAYQKGMADERAKISKSLTGKHHSKETRLKMSKMRKGRPKSIGMRKKTFSCKKRKTTY